MFNPLFGNSLTYENGSDKWMSSDSPETYNKNCEEDKNFENKWKNVEITYSLNFDGYRCPPWSEIDWSNSVVVFGDSCVAGVGVPLNHTMPKLLEDRIKKPVINMGVAGSSNIFSLYNMLNMRNADIIPYAVINIETTPERTLTFSKVRNANTGIHHWGSWEEENIYYKRFWLRNEENYDAHNEYIRFNKRFLWEKTRYLEYSSFKNREGDLRILPFKPSEARDKLHPGIDTYSQQAKVIEQEWIKNGWMD